MHKFEIYDDVEFINDGVKEVGSIDSINEEEGTAVVGLEFHPFESKTFRLSELTLIPDIKVSGDQLLDFLHFDCTAEQIVDGRWYEFYPDYNLFCTEDEVHISMDDIKQGIKKIDELDMWKSEEYEDWSFILSCIFEDILVDPIDKSPDVNIDNDACDLVEYMINAVTRNGEYGKEYFFRAADEIQERYRLEIANAN